MAESLLVVDQLHKQFGAVTATRNFSLTLKAGETHALIGPNGAGKTTVLAQLSGELQPDAGIIRLSGRDITRLPVHARARLGLARSFQITALFPEFSTEDNVAMAIQAQTGHSFRFWRSARCDPRLREPARQVLQQLGLQEQAAIPAKHLAHGEQRQLEVAMALASQPKLLLLDEPMAGMGPGGSRRMAELLRGLKGQLTVLLVEHDMDAVFALADRISVLVYGEIIATGTPDEIRADPAVRKAYLGDTD